MAKYSIGLDYGTNSVRAVVGVGVDTTGSTPLPVDRDGNALAMTRKFRKHGSGAYYGQV